MAFSDLWSRRRDTDRYLTEESLSEVLEKYDLIEVNDEPGKEFAVAAPRLSNELGSTAPSPWTSFTRQEYNPVLQGLSGLQVFDKMRKSDGTVRGTLRSIKTPALAGRWFVEPPDTDGLTEEEIELHKQIARFIWCNLTEYMTIGWPQVLTEALLMADFGYYMFEKVWENRIIGGEYRTVLRKLAPRHPMDVKEWKFDANGGPVSCVFFNNMSGDVNKDIEIPIDKLIVFTFDREAGNIEGISVLRSAYKHYYYKEQLYKIDAIQKERHGIGIPMIKLPLGYNDEDKRIADELGRNIRSNERAHITLPPGWELTMLKLEGQPVDCLKSIDHHDEAIRENILVNFVVEGAQEADMTMFLKASRFVADIVCDAFNSYLIPQMVKYNWPEVERMPRLRVRRIGEAADWRTLSFAIRNLIGAGVIIPDERLEAHLRDEMDLPPLDKETARLIATPQNPYDINEDIDDVTEEDLAKEAEHEDLTNDQGNPDPVHNTNNPQYNRNRRKLRRNVRGRKQRGQVAGLPRQTPVGQQTNAFKLPRRNQGTDRSGG